MTRNAAQPARAGPTTHNSLGLEALLKQVQPDRSYAVLDLGRALSHNVEFWSRYICKIHFVDFYGSLVTSKEYPPPEGVSFGSVLQSVMPFDPSDRFDIVLTWDLFNYLAPAEIESMVLYLSSFCQPGALLLTLISSQPEMPSAPMSFRIVEQDQMIYEMQSSESRPCPRFQARDISKALIGFRVSGSFLLRHGIQEHLFAYEPGGE